MTSLSPFLMFVGDQHGKAEEAAHLYAAAFADAALLGIERFGPDEGQPMGSVKAARLRIGGTEVRLMDSDGPHPFTFTPAASLFVECDSAAAVRDAADRLAEGGRFLMPLDAYPFSPAFAWVQDRFGVSWQLTLASDAGV